MIMLRCVPAIVVRCGFSSSGFQIFDDYAKLDKVLAAFYEGLRMFRKLDILKYLLSWSWIIYFAMDIAPGHLLIREAAEDTVLEIPKPHGQVGTTTIPVPKGVQVSWL